VNADIVKTYRLGLIGARGYVGSELIKLVQAHPGLELAFVSSRERDGQLLSEFEQAAPAGMRYCNYSPAQALQDPVDVLVLALPNGLAEQWVAAFDAADSAAILIDLSADYRFDADWHYGLPELTRENSHGQRRISNPGCYATAMQLAIAPMCASVAGAVSCFGVSGYSGAGTSPSDKNNPELLKDNLMPYALVEHIHEREVAKHMACDVHFMPHVAAHFRGLSMTCSMPLSTPATRQDIVDRYKACYADEPLVELCDAAPWLSQVVGTPFARIGGFTLSQDGKRLVVVSVIDNLLKGAASQAMQNINNALKLPETMGIL
jgi:N-acetyl-gamma-glutamyl-phosphate reductase